MFFFSIELNENNFQLVRLQNCVKDPHAHFARPAVRHFSFAAQHFLLVICLFVFCVDSNRRTHRQEMLFFKGNRRLKIA